MTDVELAAAWGKISKTYRYSINGERYIEVQRGERGVLVPFNAKTFAEWCGDTLEGYDAAAEAAQRIADAREGFSDE